MSLHLITMYCKKNLLPVNIPQAFEKGSVTKQPFTPKLAVLSCSPPATLIGLWSRDPPAEQRRASGYLLQQPIPHDEDPQGVSSKVIKNLKQALLNTV